MTVEKEEEQWCQLKVSASMSRCHTKMQGKNDSSLSHVGNRPAEQVKSLILTDVIALPC